MSYEEEKSHVGMIMCMLCDKPAAIALDKRLRKSLPRQMYHLGQLCDACKEKTKDMIQCVIVEREGDDKIIDMMYMTENGLRAFHKPGPELDAILAIRKCAIGRETFEFIKKKYEEAVAEQKTS